MIAKNIINLGIPPLQPTDSIDKALRWMSEFRLQEFPVVKERKLLGIIREEQLLDFDRPDWTLEMLPDEFLFQYINENDHIFDVIKILHNNNLGAIPVLDSEKKFLGTISRENVIAYFATASSFQDPGGIIVIETNRADYSMSEIAQIVESNDASILSSYVSLDADTQKFIITLKLNRQDVSAILATFNRYDYTIKASFQEEDYSEDLKERLDSFFKYLDL